MNPQFKPRYEIDVILTPSQDPVAQIHSTGKIHAHQLGTTGEVIVFFSPPSACAIRIEQMEAILEAMKKFQADENPKPDSPRQTDLSHPQGS